MTITISVMTDEISAALDRLGAAMADPTPAMRSLGDYFMRSTRQRFQEGTAPDGSVWAPKSPVTLARHPGKTQPLIRDGFLSRSISAEAFPDRVEWGSDRAYAAVQQFGAAQGAFGRTSRGGPIPWGNIPARPFLGISAEDEVAVLDIIDEWLTEAAAAGA